MDTRKVRASEASRATKLAAAAVVYEQARYERALKLALRRAGCGCQG